ncbi:helix-turn-helix domain-containing protein [Paenibacillus donghaensis]|uniref:Uncharacterized protein n=1 Tax=Paenibacillus donghaensis TaxID=414771 RepID=A0A2Z2KNX2_9BACL|nr:helix-turn-helix domain-containing protein [Paenibacillus donghaensis]ASA25390.1 hypothetical protein B9T62_34450 [Paenibacillus donghaensis]
MKYSELLSKYIEESGLSLGEIAIRLSNKNIKIDRSYISKLKNGNKPPASEDISRALAEVTGGKSQELLMASYIEKAPEEVQPALQEFNKFRILFSIIRKLTELLEFYWNYGFVQKNILEVILSLADDVKDELNIYILTEHLENDPEYAADIIAQLKHSFFPFSESLVFGNFEIKFSDYVDEYGNGKRKKSNKIVYDVEEPVIVEFATDQVIREAEEEYGVNLRDDPEVMSAVREIVRSFARMKKK